MTASVSASSVICEFARREVGAPCATAADAPAIRPRATCPDSSPPTDACAAPNLRRDSALRPFEQHCDAARMQDVERARLQLRAKEARRDIGDFVGLDDERSGRLRQRVQPEACSHDEGQPSLGAADEAR